MARDLLCKASDKAKCGVAQARVAQQARSAAEAPKVRRRHFFLLKSINNKITIQTIAKTAYAKYSILELLKRVIILLLLLNVILFQPTVSILI
ncbi:hypothetical protein K0V43_19365, partial [Leptospira sp. id769339]|nr:hypothetical protein [Leptospira sp. id769339]